MAEIKALRDHRSALKAALVPAVAAPAKPKAKAALKAPVKAAAPAKATKPTFKKKYFLIGSGFCWIPAR
ncbi:MAG: hypothetical protein ACD_6C00714G0003 [uncultured bacterium]|nr:MAG: hypothetical protein ACD_6C00714G0003 [uncultured bacterium]